MTEPVIQVDHLNKWYGSVIALNDVSLTVPPGITVCSAQWRGQDVLHAHRRRPDAPLGRNVRVLGQDPWNNVAHNLRTGYCPSTTVSTSG